MATQNPKPTLGQALPLGPTGESLMSIDDLIAELEKMKKASGNIDIHVKKVDDHSLAITAPKQPGYCCQAAEVLPLRDVALIPAFR